MNCCYIFGALPCREIQLNIDDTDLIIAADAGLGNLNEIGITPHYIVGDFDSLNYEPTGDNVIKHPVRKDETDTILAIDIGFEKGFKRFIIYGCVGGRLDHTYANIQAAAYVTQKGGNAVFIGPDFNFTVIKDNYVKFSDKNKGVISVFALSSTAIKVTEKGLLYELDKEKLSPDYPLGVSNEFIGKESYVSVKDGTICIMWEDINAEYIIGGYDE